MNKKLRSGFVMQALLIIVALFILSYMFGVDVIGFLESPPVKSFFVSLGSFVKSLWNWIKGVIDAVI